MAPVVTIPTQKARRFTSGGTSYRARLLLLSASCLGTLLLGETAVRLTAALTHHVPLVVSDARAGWALQPNLHAQLRVGDGGQFVISTDAEGHRLTRSAGTSADRMSPTVILVGDSFVQGQSVNDSETFAWLLAEETSLNVVNLGVLGYGTDQELVSLEAYLETHPAQPIRDIVVLVFDNDFIDVQTSSHPALGRSKPRFTVTEGRLEMPGYQRTFSDQLMDRSALYWLVNSKRALLCKDPEPDCAGGLDVVVACIAAMRELAARRGIALHVLAHQHLRKPRPFPEGMWEDFLHRSGALDITPYLRSLKDADPISYDGGHWSAAGHRRVATVVKELITSVATP